MRKTKIICTMGPAVEVGDVMERLVQEGMNVARFNFSHGDHDEQRKRLQKLRVLRERYGKPIASLLDTKGPEIRICDFENGRIELKAGQKFVLTADECLGNEERVGITYKDLVKDVKPGTHILIDDGLIDTEVVEVSGNDVVLNVINGGSVSNHKGINVPGIHLNLPFVSEKDKKDILFAIEEDMDYIAASFVRTAQDVMEIRKLLADNGGENIKIVAKIENGEGIDNIDEIIEAADAIMVARGDMGVEIPAEEVPIVQKMIIKKVYQAGKQVITATQMLDSMMKNPRPTRAEATDVANAIYDGTSAIMLSGETANGKYPVEALQMMVRIATRTEQSINYRKRFKENAVFPELIVESETMDEETANNKNIARAISHATCTTAHDLNAAAIVTVTKSGSTARMVSRFRPECDIIGCCLTDKVFRQLNLSWGVTPVLLQEKSDFFELIEHASCVCKTQGLLKSGDTVVFTAGVPIGMMGTTNMVKVHTIN